VEHHLWSKYYQTRHLLTGVLCISCPWRSALVAHQLYLYTAVLPKVVQQNAKAYATMPIGIMSCKVWRCLIEVHGVEQERRKNYEYTGLCCFLLQAATP